MSRIILCRVGERPCVTWLDADLLDGGHATALGRLLGVSVVRIPLHDGVQLYCDRDGLLLGLSLARRAVASFPAAPRRSETALRFDRSGPVPGSDEWPVSADFLLARANDGGGLVDLTDSDIEHWMFWLELDRFLNPNLPLRIVNPDDT